MSHRLCARNSSWELPAHSQHDTRHAPQIIACAPTIVTIAAVSAKIIDPPVRRQTHREQRS
jgi:hypothetical protein